MSNYLKVLKLSNGDEIIGFIQDGSKTELKDKSISLDHMIFIKSPMKIMQDYDETVKSHVIFLIEWFPSGRSSSLPIPKDHIITMDTPKNSVEDYYYDVMGEYYAPELELGSEEEKQSRLFNKLNAHEFSDDEIN